MVQDRITEHLEALVAMRTTGDRPEELHRAVEYVAETLQGLQIHKYKKDGKPSIVVTFQETQIPKVIFVGHLDVVPADDAQFQPRIEGAKLYGRGALDMKGPDAVLLTLFEHLRDQGSQPPIGLMLTTDEESGGEAGVGYLLREAHWRTEFAVIPDGGIGFTLITDGKGVIHLKFHAKGVPTHGSTPWRGVNPIDQLLELYHHLKARVPQEPCGDPEHWHRTVNLGKLCGGDAPNRVPEEAEMFLDFRFPAPYTPEEIWAEVREVLAQYPGITVEELARGEPVHTDLDHPYLQLFRQAAEEVLARSVKLGKEHGATDGRFFAELGIPVIVIYPIGDDIHGKNEWVDLPSLETLYRIFEGFVQRLEP